MKETVGYKKQSDGCIERTHVWAATLRGADNVDNISWFRN